MGIAAFWKRLIRKPDENDPVYREEFAKRISSKILRYVSERTTDADSDEVIDTIIGRDGHFSINADGYLTIYCEGVKVFSCKCRELKAYEFLSLEGAVLEGFDSVKGKHRQIIAYYKYYR
ncbi:hypothetical protein FACS1894219_11510 [Clostridia bacterium]|nr:hypothetical protein FACS1894219_11510 [Clostridia bacterium]